MAKRYARLNWQNKPSAATPIDATNLKKMDKGIDDIDTALNNLENSIVGQIVNDPTKINNAAVNYSLANQISELNNNLGAIKLVIRGIDGGSYNLTLENASLYLFIRSDTSGNCELSIIATKNNAIGINRIKVDPYIAFTTNGLVLTATLTYSNPFALYRI